LKRQIITTADGSKTIYLKDWNENYHSKHGAILEARHVFIHHGLHALQLQSINLLEIGFGTGLNALITLMEADGNNFDVNYTGIEAFPVSPAELMDLNYVEELNAKAYSRQFQKMHNATWEIRYHIQPNFTMHKKKMDFHNVSSVNAYHLIYFDAFGPRVQPELWTSTIFNKMYTALKSGGILVTYSAKGSVRRNLQEVGFVVERLPGPPGKREMLRACKL